MPQSHHQSPAENQEGNIRGYNSMVTQNRPSRENGFFEKLLESISRERLRPYSVNSEINASVIAAYVWNIALCESLYPALNCLEIALRNSVHAAGTNQFNTEYWFNGRLRQEEADRVRLLRNRLNTSGNKNPSVGDLVSGLSLGFWVSLFKGQYERVLWPCLLPEVFPHAPRRQRSRREISKRLDRIRRLRNRVFHHEPVWRLPDLAERHRLILETIGWISPAMLAMTGMMDRFPSVYTMGPQSYADELESVAQNWSS